MNEINTKITVDAQELEDARTANGGKQKKKNVSNGTIRRMHQRMVIVSERKGNQNDPDRRRTENLQLLQSDIR